MSSDREDGDYDSGPFCVHWSDWECIRPCGNCGHPCHSFVGPCPVDACGCEECTEDPPPTPA